MFTLSFAARHLLRHWKLHLALLLGLTLAAGLLSALPGYASMIAGRSLRESLLAHSLPAERNLTVSATSSFRLTAAVYGLIRDSLGDLLVSRLEFYDTTVLPPGRYEPAGERGPTIQAVHFWASDSLASNVRVLEGRWPAYVPPPPNAFTTPIQEAAIGAPAAAAAGLEVGDYVTVTGPLVLVISAIVEPIDSHDDVWWGTQEVFGLAVRNDPNFYVATLPLIVPAQTLKTYLGGYQTHWRILLDRDGINADNATATLEAITNLQTRLQSQQVTLSSGLPKILSDYQSELATARTALFLLTAQAVIFVLYALSMATSFLLERSQGELSILAGRGAARLQVTLVFALEGLLLGALAAVAGPLLANRAAQLWAAASGEQPFPGLSLEAWLLALIAAGFGWLAIVVPAHWATRRTVLEWQHSRARPARLAGWQRLYLDLFLLLFGGLAYWQLAQSGSFLMSTVGSRRLADPFLLLSSSLLLVAVALVFLRLFPLLLDLAAWIAHRGRGLALSHSLARLARAPLGPSRVVLMISLAAGLILFTNGFTSSLVSSQVEQAYMEAGADLRIALDQKAGVAVEEDGLLQGVLAASPAFRTVASRADRTYIDLLAVNPATFVRVSTSPAVASLVPVLRQGAFTDTLPGIVSRSSVPAQSKVGDRLELTLANQKLTIEIRALVDTFPTLEKRFVVTNLDALSRQIDLGGGRHAQSGEVWLVVDPAQHAALASDPRLAGRILGDAQSGLRRMQADALAQGTVGAFQLNTGILGVLSVVSFFLVQYFAARQRSYEFSLLRTLGLAPGQLWTLLVSEGVLVVGLGLAAGTAIGYGLARAMIPFLSRALASSMAGVEIRQVVIDWPQVGCLYALLGGCYLVALALLLLVLRRSGLHRVLRLGEE